MNSLGLNLLFFGVGSIVLRMFNMEFIILSWVDSWGEVIGWCIRGGIILLGAVLSILGLMRR